MNTSGLLNFFYISHDFFRRTWWVYLRVFCNPSLSHFQRTWKLVIFFSPWKFVFLKDTSFLSLEIIIFVAFYEIYKINYHMANFTSSFNSKINFDLKKRSPCIKHFLLQNSKLSDLNATKSVIQLFVLLIVFLNIWKIPSDSALL